MTTQEQHRQLAQICEQDFETPNLDALEIEELEELGRVYTRLAMFCTVAHQARTERRNGFIRDALCKEKEAEELYQRLPSWARW